MLKSSTFGPVKAKNDTRKKTPGKVCGYEVNHTWVESFLPLVRRLSPISRVLQTDVLDFTAMRLTVTLVSNATIFAWINLRIAD